MSFNNDIDKDLKLAHIKLPRKRRSLSNINITLNNIDLKLSPAQSVLSNEFVMLSRFDNTTANVRQVNPEHDSKCFYTYQSQQILSVVDICNGVNGLVTLNNTERYLIRPLPKRFWKTPDEPIPHLLIRTTETDQTPSKTRKPRMIPYNQFDHANSMYWNQAYPNWLRRRRSSIMSAADVKVETAIFVDRDLYQHMTENFPDNTERQLLRFVLAMVNAVQLLYHDSSLGRKVNFVLKRLEILHQEPAGLQRPHDIDLYLSSFCTWQQKENPLGDARPLHWDHALMLTGLDLYVIGKSGKISNQVVGLAPVAGMCLPSSSCTVNEGRHFESVYVVAHEIGHNLGMRHDGPSADNNCDPGLHIMSPTLGSGKTTWSSCSYRYLQMFLLSPQAQCLFDSTGVQLDHGEGGVLPGERFDVNMQCILKYGKGSGHADTQPLEEVCRDLHCRRERYTWTSHPALEGTKCGPNKWCRRGRCMTKGLAGLTEEVVDGKWGDWSGFAECASGCLYSQHDLHRGSSGVSVASRRCNNPSPENGGRKCEGSDKRFRTCEAIQCANIPPTTITEFAEQICRRAKDVDRDLTGGGFQKLSFNPEEACTVWCTQRNGGAKSRSWIFPDGTTCHIKQFSHKPYFCVSGRCEEFECQPNNHTIFIAGSDLCSRRTYEDNKLGDHDDDGGWTPAGPCHYRCIVPGRGLRVMKRNIEHNIQLCDPDVTACARRKSIYEHASKICGKYKDRVRKLSGLGIQLSPSLEDPDRPCHVACQDETVIHRFYLVTGEDGWFPFGTDCSRGLPGKKSYCVSGKCLEFGVDDTPLYESKYIFPNIRKKRSFETYNTTVTATLDPVIINNIVQVLTHGQENRRPTPESTYTIDLNNPVHEEMNWFAQTDHRQEFENPYYQVNPI